MQSCKHEKKHEKGKHFRQKLFSQNIRNDVSEHQVFKILWGSMSPWLMHMVPA